MVEYSILTPFLGASDLDEININAWDDITLTYSDGSMKSSKNTSALRSTPLTLSKGFCTTAE